MDVSHDQKSEMADDLVVGGGIIQVWDELVRFTRT